MAAGEQELIEFTYSITDDVGAVSTANVTITVAGENDAPVAVNDLASLSEDDGLTGNVFADNLNGVDFDVDSALFTVFAVNGLQANVGAPITTSNGGQITINADGSFEFFTNGAYDNLSANGSINDSIDEVFTYTIADDFNACLLYTSPSPRDATLSRMPSSA